MNATHEWFRGRLAEFLAGVLSPEDEQRLEAHAAECAECSALLDLGRAALSGWAAEAAHVPSAALVAFAEHPAGLLPIERELVAAHVERCAECAADLGELRGTGVDVALVAAAAGASQGGTDGSRVIALGPRRRGRDMLIGGFVGGLATAAAFVFVVGPLTRAPAPPATATQPAPGSGAPGIAGPAAPGGPARGEPAAPGAATAPPGGAAGSSPSTSAGPGASPRGSGSGPALGAMLPARTLAARERGASAETLRVDVSVGGRFLPLRLPALFVEPATRLDVTLAGPDGQLFARHRVRYRDVLPPQPLVVDLGGAAPGVYELRVVALGDGGREPRVFYLEVLPVGR